MVEVAVVGVGGWGINHAKTLAKLRALGIIDDFHIIDVSEDRAKYVAKIYNADYELSIGRGIKRWNLDAAIIATPTPFHYEHAKTFLESGIHVLVEKPITVHPEEVVYLIELAKANNRIIMTGFLLRYSSATQYLRKMFEKEERKLGNILLISAKRVNPWRIRKYDVGVVKDLMIHDIDLVSYLFNAKPIRVFATGKKMSFPFEVFATAIIDFELKDYVFSLWVEASWISGYKFRRWEVSSEKAAVSLDLVNHSVTIYSEDGILSPKIEIREPLLEQDKNFILSIKGVEQPLVSAIDGYKALVVCEKIHKAITSGTVIEIKEDDLQI